ncbi:MAG: hypothetical protein UHL07_00750 [Bacteroidaceae bacterium]|nr:hypothetical protein [Bacteroidaceae bacterium]
MKKIFALVAVAMVSATAFVSCTKNANTVEALKELAAADSADTTAILAMVETLKADTTMTEADLATIDSIAALFTVCEEEVEETVCDSICADSACADSVIEAAELVPATEVAE